MIQRVPRGKGTWLHNPYVLVPRARRHGWTPLAVSNPVVVGQKNTVNNPTNSQKYACRTLATMTASRLKATRKYVVEPITGRSISMESHIILQIDATTLTFWRRGQCVQSIPNQLTSNPIKSLMLCCAEMGAIIWGGWKVPLVFPTLEDVSRVLGLQDAWTRLMMMMMMPPV